MRNPTPDPSEAPADLTGRRWSFGPAVLDERSLELEVAGQAVKLERKPLEVLLYLLHHAGEVVTKDDLAEALWPGRILTETVLTRCISLLRTALQDEARTLIRTVHGFGYRLIADVRVEVSAGPPAPPSLDFRPGDHPPQRPQWKLVERLGTGGHGEAWLARHEKTGDARVFKFAVDVRALTSLKREITLYRLLHDSLGQRAAVARIFEWNLTEPPYFIEVEHVAGGNLATWAEAQGGLAAISLTARLELVARIADAVAAAHSVGALHKDLKPGNVLVHVENATPQIKLCDFGSGGVMDPQRLEALGITRQGFTKTMTGTTSATPLYLAPEVIAGQPFTIQADIYSLGILLYQVVAGDLRRALAPGWEADVSDELLREDIAAAAAGNPAKRLTDAGQLAERLRGLADRRVLLEEQRAAAKRAELVRRVSQELYRARVVAVLLMLFSGAAIVGGVVAYQAREEALAAEATATAVNTFLMEDVLRVDRTVERPQADSYKATLDRAASKVGSRFADRPAAAATIHWLLGRRYQELEQISAAVDQYEQAATLNLGIHGPAAPETLLAKERLANIYVDNGRRADALPIIEQLLIHWAASDKTDLEALLWRARLGRTLVVAGDLPRAEAILRGVLKSTPNSGEPDRQTAAPLFLQWIGHEPTSLAAMRDLVSGYASELMSGVLGEVRDECQEAEPFARDALTAFARVAGADGEQAAFARVRLGGVLVNCGKHTEGETTLAHAQSFYDHWLPAGHYYRSLPRYWIGVSRLEQQKFAEALSQLKQAESLCRAACPRRLKVVFLTAVGEAYWRQRELDKAIDALRVATSIQDSLPGPRLIVSERTRINLASVLLEKGDLEAAHAALRGVNTATIEAFPKHRMRARYRRIEGLLADRAGYRERALAALEEARAILQSRFGSDHWRTKEVENDLARIRAKRQ